MGGDKILIKVSFEQHSSENSISRGILRVPGFIPLKGFLQQFQILFLLNVSLLMDKYVDCFFPGIKVDENGEKNPFALSWGF